MPLLQRSVELLTTCNTYRNGVIQGYRMLNVFHLRHVRVLPVRISSAAFSFQRRIGWGYILTSIEVKILCLSFLFRTRTASTVRLVSRAFLWRFQDHRRSGFFILIITIFPIIIIGNHDSCVPVIAYVYMYGYYSPPATTFRSMPVHRVSFSHSLEIYGEKSGCIAAVAEE